jgi:hypothetical protein
VNKGELQKYLILANRREERSKDRESPEPRNASSSGLSLPFLFNAAAALLLLISPTGGRSLY